MAASRAPRSPRALTGCARGRHGAATARCHAFSRQFCKFGRFCTPAQGLGDTPAKYGGHLPRSRMTPRPSSARERLSSGAKPSEFAELARNAKVRPPAAHRSTAPRDATHLSCKSSPRACAPGTRSPLPAAPPRAPATSRRRSSTPKHPRRASWPPPTPAPTRACAPPLDRRPTRAQRHRPSPAHATARSRALAYVPAAPTRTPRACDAPPLSTLAMPPPAHAPLDRVPHAPPACARAVCGATHPRLASWRRSRPQRRSSPPSARATRPIRPARPRPARPARLAPQP